MSTTPTLKCPCLILKISSLILFSIGILKRPSTTCHVNSHLYYFLYSSPRLVYVFYILFFLIPWQMGKRKESFLQITVLQIKAKYKCISDPRFYQSELTLQQIMGHALHNLRIRPINYSPQHTLFQRVIFDFPIFYLFNKVETMIICGPIWFFFS